MKGLLVTNGFLHSGKFSEIYEWLLNAAKKKGIQLVHVTNSQLLFCLGNLDKEEVLKDCEFVLFWDKDVKLAYALENRGLKLFNKPQAIACCDDKAMTHLVLEKYRLPMPKTIIGPMTYENIGYSNLDFLEQVENKLGFPVVVKECFGSFGQQVYLAESHQMLIELVKKIGVKPMLFQEFIKESAGRDVRLQVVGGNVITAMYRYSVQGDFRANVSNGGKMKPYEPSETEKNLAIRSCKALGVDFAGVDLLFGKDNLPLICEINSNAHFKNIYDCTGVNTADAIMDYIYQECRL
ncbi:ATP-grasp domain-containing protein [Anaeromicropila populeti]|uniref:Ribosomal protein S6--L-glutamate ligase n=1 Tax=Anaeromicropila populeti TaxID=37658 RepID=A0A1I6KHH2_9FIRM|nr:RimK family alpha-L-glutamate ligase [Anaeromicropila populeti]SFR90685.1 ribosomal protein S6--L-glutamate ligase [Anaeromicropila populeti]